VELQKTGAARDMAMRERDALTAEKNELWKRIDGLILEKSALTVEKTALVQERDGLARDKAVWRRRWRRSPRRRSGFLPQKRSLNSAFVT